ncbi:MAG: sensor histidine kinase, partial [Candidatus Dormibacteraceae bacterium]
MSLRLRLLLALLALVAIALSAIDAITYLAIQSSLSQQINSQIASSADAVDRYLTQEADGLNPQGGFPLPAGGSYGELIGANGNLIYGKPLYYIGQPQPPPPRFPGGFPSHPVSQATYTTVPAKGGGEYRVLQSPPDPLSGVTLVLAFPLTQVDSTLRQLRLLELVVTGGVLLLMAALAWWIVQLGLRPLARIRATAKAIAAGDLSQRVPSTDPHTEVGQLGISLNEMLGQIETAFRVQAASEARMRQFMADASHELRTPLSSIRGYAELFRRGARANPQDLEKTMTRIESEASRMGRMVEDLLLLARLDEGRALESRPVDLSQLAVDSAADQSVADRRHRFTVSAAEPVLVLGDEARLRQVVGNLVGNAVVHTPAGTAIEIATHLGEGFGKVEVRDHGPGIPEAAAPRVFERFYRVDKARGRSTGGAGLGLA